jgi:hypothetical protein
MESFLQNHVMLMCNNETPDHLHQWYLHQSETWNLLANCGKRHWPMIKTWCPIFYCPNDEKIYAILEKCNCPLKEDQNHLVIDGAIPSWRDWIYTDYSHIRPILIVRHDTGAGLLSIRLYLEGPSSELERHTFKYMYSEE